MKLVLNYIICFVSCFAYQYFLYMCHIMFVDIDNFICGLKSYLCIYIYIYVCVFSNHIFSQCGFCRTTGGYGAARHPFGLLGPNSRITICDSEPMSDFVAWLSALRLCPLGRGPRGVRSSLDLPRSLLDLPCGFKPYNGRLRRGPAPVSLVGITVHGLQFVGRELTFFLSFSFRSIGIVLWVAS